MTPRIPVKTFGFVVLAGFGMQTVVWSDAEPATRAGTVVMLAGIGFTAGLLVFVAWASRSMAGTQRGPYRMHFDTLGRKRPCYPDQCGCAWRADEMEEAA